MLPSMELQISHAETLIVFEFQQPTSVHMLVVSDAREQVLWEIAPERRTETAPASPSAPVPVLSGGFAGVRVPHRFERILSEAIEADRERYPHLSRVVYGQLPPGYREVVQAKELTAGQMYCVLVFGAGLDSFSDFFTPRNEAGPI
jgi:hypothetical protein